MILNIGKIGDHCTLPTRVAEGHLRIGGENLSKKSIAVKSGSLLNAVSECLSSSVRNQVYCSELLLACPYSLFRLILVSLAI